MPYHGGSSRIARSRKSETLSAQGIPRFHLYSGQGDSYRQHQRRYHPPLERHHYSEGLQGCACTCGTSLLPCHAYSIVPPRSNADRDFLFEQLGEQFTRAQLVEQAVNMGVKENTAIAWLKRLTKRGVLVNVDGKGTYTRARVRV